MITLKDAVCEIVKSFTSGKIFDSHGVIEELRNNPKYSGGYLHEISGKQNEAQYHGRIAQIIRDSGLAEAVPDGNKDMLINTKNVHGELTENHVWKRK